MSQNLIIKLTSDQQKLFSAQKQKWLSIIARPLEEKKVKEILAKLYRDLGYEIPEILIVDSPQAAERILSQKKKQKELLGLQIFELLDNQSEQRLNERVKIQIENHLIRKLEAQLREPLWKQLYAQFWLPIYSHHRKQFGNKKATITFNLTELSYACYFDFARQIGVNFDEKDYEIYTQFYENISMYLAFENLALAIERPIFVNWNEAGKLHAEGKPAIQFRDGFSIYAYDGTKLPLKYGKLHPDEWASKWLRGGQDSELIPYIEKWQKICLSTESIDSERAIQAVKEIYKLMDYSEPEILLFDSLGAALHKIDYEEKFLVATGKSLSSEFRKKFWNIFSQELQNQLDELLSKLSDTILFNYLSSQQSRTVSHFLEMQLYSQRRYQEEDSDNDDELDEDENRDCFEENNRSSAAVIDCEIVSSNFLRLCNINFSISELKSKLDLQKWESLQDLMSNCSAVWLYENICLICDRPNRISFDDNGCLHGEGIPAIQFSDGFGVYAFRNIWLPEQYGKIHSSQWKTEWFLEDNIAEIEQVLIENIGYERINRELNERQLTARDKYEILRTNLYDKVTLTGKMSSSQAPENNAIDLNSLPSYEFEVISVDSRGEITNKEKKQAKIFTEDLGNNIILEMMGIPAGEFLMGNPEGNGEESPQHLVKLSSFLLSKYPITQAQWRAVASLPKVKLDLNPEPSNFIGDTRPVERITKEEALEFCVRLWQKTGKLYCLPSEAQWEYACRANTTTPFHFGETITSNLANYNGEYCYEHEPAGIFRRETLPVGRFPPNAFGLYDLHGNVLEWCADNWHENYHGASEDEKSRIGGCDEYASVRGGGWKSKPFLCRSANRNDEFRRRDIGYSDVGFRVAHLLQK